jgi:hypothetical protein
MAMTYSAGAAIGIIVGFVLSIAAIVIAVWAIVDVIRTPREAFSAAGSSKPFWLILLLVFAVLAFYVTAVLGLVYFFSARPRVRAMIEVRP